MWQSLLVLVSGPSLLQLCLFRLQKINKKFLFIYCVTCVTFLFSDGQNMCLWLWNKSNSVSSDDEKCSCESLPKEGDFIQHHNYMSYFPTKSVTSLENCTKSYLKRPYSGTWFKSTPIHQSRKYFLWSTTGNTVLLIFSQMFMVLHTIVCVQSYGLGIARVHPTFINRQCTISCTFAKQVNCKLTRCFFSCVWGWR